MGKGIKIHHNVLLAPPHYSDSGSLVVGKNVTIGNDTEIDISGGVTIGDEVWISQRVIIETHKHNIRSRKLKKLQGISFNSLHIGHDSWIGAGAIVLSGTGSIGRGAIVGAGSVVTKKVPDWTIVAGIPAHKIGIRER